MPRIYFLEFVMIDHWPHIWGYAHMRAWLAYKNQSVVIHNLNHHKKNDLYVIVMKPYYRSQLTIVNNLKLETKRKCFWAGSSNDMNVDLSASFQTCHKRHDRSVAHLTWQSACTIGNKLALQMQFTQESCEWWQCGSHQNTMWHTNIKLKFTPKHSQEPPGGGARLVPIEVDSFLQAGSI